MNDDELETCFECGETQAEGEAGVYMNYTGEGDRRTIWVCDKCKREMQNDQANIATSW